MWEWKLNIFLISWKEVEIKIRNKNIFLKWYIFFVTHQLFLSLPSPQLFLPLLLPHLLLLLATIGGDYEICFFLRRGIIVNIVSLLPPSPSILKLPSTFLPPPLPLFCFPMPSLLTMKFVFLKYIIVINIPLLLPLYRHILYSSSFIATTTKITSIIFNITILDEIIILIIIFILKVRY